MPTDLINTLMVALQVFLALLGGFLAAFHISLVIWTFRDIRSRSRDAFAHLLAAALVLFFSLPGLLLYLILRPRETLAEQYERALEEEALLQDIEERLVCPGCQRKAEPDFMVCPSCHTQLKVRCRHCGRLLHPKWDICPYCARSTAPPPPEMWKEEVPEPATPVPEAGPAATPPAEAPPEPEVPEEVGEAEPFPAWATASAPQAEEDEGYPAEELASEGEPEASEPSWEPAPSFYGDPEPSEEESEEEKDSPGSEPLA
ncbi:MAG: zinc ribbon domain-containing protein [Anaerolineae bacterium]|nr:zinc ribbon domain-containing protein [Anaerolineae bacterium]